MREGEREGGREKERQKEREICLLHESNELLRGSATHDRVINKDNDAVLDHGLHRIELAPHLEVPVLLPRRNITDTARNITRHRPSCQCHEPTSSPTSRTDGAMLFFCARSALPGSGSGFWFWCAAAAFSLASTAVSRADRLIG